MTVVTAHRILIGTAVVFFLFYAGRELVLYTGSGDAWAVVRALIAAAVAIGFGVYWRTIPRR
jgi:hypothetical protein